MLILNPLKKVQKKTYAKKVINENLTEKWSFLILLLLYGKLFGP